MIAPFLAVAMIFSPQESLGGQRPAVSTGSILPAPTGASAIGRVTYHWIDSDRADPFARDSLARREVLVDVWYPAAPGAGPSAPYLPGLSQLRQVLSDSVLRRRFAPAYEAITADRLLTHAVEGAPARCAVDGCPLLIFSHGGGIDRSLYTAQYEDLASHGYIVAAIAHTYLTHTVVLPDGRALRILDRRPPQAPAVDSTMSYWRRRFAESAAINRMRYAVAADDIRFVIDQMLRAARDSASGAPFLGQLAQNRIGALGHSMGGLAVAAACLADLRIRACMNQDGTSDALPAFRDATGRTLSQPFAYFGRVERSGSPRADSVLARIEMTRQEDDSIRAARPLEQLALLRDVARGAWRLRLRVPEAEHMSFSDEPLIQAGDDATMRARALRILAIVNRYTRGFFDKTLMHRADTILDHQPPEDTVFLSIERFAPKSD